MLRLIQKFFTCTIVFVYWLTPSVSEAEDMPGRFDKGIAVVDISLVFKRCDYFKEEMANIKDEVAKYEVELAFRAAHLQELKSKLSESGEDSEEHDSLANKITSLTKSNQSDAEARKAEFLKRETALYADVYETMTEEIGDIARENKLVLVVRHSSKKMDRSKRNMVLEHVNRAELFHENIDITPQVIERLNVRLDVSEFDD